MFISILLASLLVIGAPTLPAEPAQMGKPSVQHKLKKAKRVIILTFDGIRVDGFQQANTPNIDALYADGAASMATRDVMPSVTLPNYTSILTGSGPEQHGVVENGWKKDSPKLPPIETDADGYYPSVFRVLKDNVPGIQTGFFYNWGKLIEPYNPACIDEAMLIKDEFVPLYEGAREFIVKHRDEPTFVFLYTGHTDHMGHVHEWMSPEYIQSIEEGDAEVGRLIEFLKKEGLYEDSYIFFISDHGGLGKHHGGTSVEEMTVPWGLRGPGIRKGFSITEPNNTVNTASTVLYLFGVPQPLCWTGEVPMSIFK